MVATTTGEQVDGCRGAREGFRRLVIVAAASSEEADGIRDYTTCLIDQIRKQGGWAANLVLLRPDDLRAGRFACLTEANPRGRRPLLPSDTDACLIQYNPFSFGRWGFAPSLLLAVLRLRLAKRRPVIVLFAHESYVSMTNWRWALMGAWQRLQLAVLRVLSDVQLGSIEVWAERMRRMPPRTAVHHLPVASNLPDTRRSARTQRALLGIPDETVVLACFGLRHAGRLEEHALRAADAVVGSGRDAYLLDLGTGIPARVQSDGLTVHSPGFLESGELARTLSTADVFLAPYADGVSTRRTTMMAALQHEIPVVATVGPLTDSMLRRAHDAITMVPVEDLDSFAEAVRGLAVDAERRRAQGRAGRAFYEENFDWPVITNRLLDVVTGSLLVR